MKVVADDSGIETLYYVINEKGDRISPKFYNEHLAYKWMDTHDREEDLP